MVDQDRMMRFRSELHGIGDLDRVSGAQMLFAFQRFVAIVLDGEGEILVARGWGPHGPIPVSATVYPLPPAKVDPLAIDGVLVPTATSSDDVPRDEPALGDQPNTAEGFVVEDPVPPADTPVELVPGDARTPTYEANTTEKITGPDNTVVPDVVTDPLPESQP